MGGLVILSKVVILSEAKDLCNSPAVWRTQQTA
jgi:hypothetical protein